MPSHRGQVQGKTEAYLESCVVAPMWKPWPSIPTEVFSLNRFRDNGAVVGAIEFLPRESSAVFAEPRTKRKCSSSPTTYAVPSGSLASLVVRSIVPSVFDCRAPQLPGNCFLTAQNAVGACLKDSHFSHVLAGTAG